MGEAPTVKCLVWDLDDTLWDGVMLEGDEPKPFPSAVTTLRALDRRGILHAVASRGEYEVAVAHLAAHGLAELFTVIEVSWGAKSDAVGRIAEDLGIGLDTIAFVDNDPVERAEVAAAAPQVRCYPAEDVAAMPERVEFIPRFVTDESRRRRQYYRVQRERQVAETEYPGPPAEFLESLALTMTVRRATEPDLSRVHELILRTNQLNTTGRTFDLAELSALCASPDHEVLVATLRDRFGSYGTIGLAVTEISGDDTVLLLLLVSCRVVSRRAGVALIDHIVTESLAANRRTVADFVPTERNRLMLVTLRFSGFHVLAETDGGITLAIDPERPPEKRRHPVRVVRESEESNA